MSGDKSSKRSNGSINILSGRLTMYKQSLTSIVRLLTGSYAELVLVEIGNNVVSLYCA